MKAIEDYLSGKKGAYQTCFELEIHHRTFYDWLRKYQNYGKAGLQPLRNNTCYPEAIKSQAVKDYNKGLGSLDYICTKYDISTNWVLRTWIKKYNGHEIFRSHNTQGDKYMAKGRKTTYEERAEIVAFCIANNDNYLMTSEQFQVSYQQVYTWVKKYKEQGYEALIDRRGKSKKPEELNQAEKSAAELKLLEAENKRLKMENDFLKKLAEVERRRLIDEDDKKSDI